MKIKLIWTDALYFFLKNLPQISALCLPWLVAGAAVEYLMVTTHTEPGGQVMYLLANVLNLAMLPIYNAGLILLMAKQAQNQHPGNPDLIKGALQVWLPFFLLHILGGPLLLITVLIMLTLVTQIGYMFLGASAGSLFGFIVIFPIVVWFLAKLSFTKIHIVLDGLQPIDAIQKSLLATRPHIRLILFCVVPFVVPIVAMLFFSVRALPDIAHGDALWTLISVVASFLLLFVDVLLFRIYMGAVQKDRPDGR